MGTGTISAVRDEIWGHMGAAMWADDLAPFGVRLSFEDDRARIALSGDFDVATGSAFVDAMTSAVARYEIVDLDLGEVSFIDTGGVRSLIKARRFADAYGCSIVCSTQSNEVRELLRISGCAELFAQSSSAASASAARLRSDGQP